MLKIIKDIKTGKNFNKNRILLLFINLILIFKLQNACSCLTSSPHGRWSLFGNINCDNTDPSCDSCPIGCFQNYKKTMWDNCFVWDDVNIYQCISCPAFCDYCTSTTSCTTCSTGYTKTAAGNCISCSAQYGTGCIDCTSTSCILCQSSIGYVLDYSSSRFFINQVNPGCFFCSTINNCLSCIDGPQCTSCAIGYYINTSLLYSGCSSCSIIQNCYSCQIYVTAPRCSSCLSGFYLNYTEPNYSCVPCTNIHNCQSCIDGPQCKLCDPDWYVDFGNQSQSCVQCSFIPNCDACIDGPYCTKCFLGFHLDFFSQNRTCVKCTLFKCLQCTDGPVCTKCQPGFFLDTTLNQCLQCIFPCIECGASGTQCTKCPSSLLYSLDTGTNTCQLCYHALSDCLTCNQGGTECYQCVSTQFYVDSSTKKCLSCSPPCQNCLNSAECLSCVDDTYVYLSATKQCRLCNTFIPRCYTCLQPSVCTACRTTDPVPYFLTYPPNSCVTCQQARPNCLTCTATPGVGPTCNNCEDKFYLENYNCHPCSASCALCTSLTLCTNCINSTYTLNNNLCPACSQLIPNCLQCTSSTTCILCTNDTIINSTGGCSLCSLTQYPDHVNQLCIPCVAPCYSCLNNDDCLTCNMFYEYVPAISRCHDLCGDSVVMTDQCDNSFGVIHDGCSDTCQQETDYTCVLYPDTVSGQSVHRSICSYNLKVNITLKQIVKVPFKNTLAWTYFIVPFLYGLPGTTSRDFTQEELKKTFVLYDINQGPPTTLSLLTTKKKINSDGINQSNHKVSKVSVPVNLTIQSVSVNAAKSEVSLTFSYDHDITQSDIELMVNFTYLRSTLNIPSFSTTPDSDKLIKVSSYRPDSMIGKFYTDDEYSLASTLNKLSLMIGLLSFVAFVIGVFSKELIGLQMVMLSQFTYISLFYFDGNLQLPLFALKSLVFSTGYNLQWSDLSYTQIDQNPPQSLTLDFDVMTLSHNFNLMSLLYVLPLILVIPFIPMKAKCIRKLSMIEMGHKWVDLLLGEIMLYIVLFNLQYFLFGMIVFYQDGRNVKEYLSSMIVSFGGLMTVCSVFGLILKPQIYGNFRTSFKYDNELRSEVIESKPKLNQSQCKKLVQRFNLFVNESYFWKNHRDFHSLLTYNHYFLLPLYFIVSILVMTMIRNSQLINLSLSAFMLIEIIVMRPYNKVSQKVRAIYFFIVFTVVCFVRYANNTLLKGQYILIMSVVLIGLLGLALIWTYIVLIHHFYLFFAEQFSDRKGMVEKVFKIETDQIDKDEVAEQQEALMRKLMKKYERVELQVNFNNTRNQLLSGYDSIQANKPFTKNTQISKITNQTKITKQKFIDQQILKKMQQQNNFKNLKQQVEKHKRKVKKEDMKKRVTGQKLLKLLSLDNFNKYEQKFLMTEQEKLEMKKQKQEKQGNQQEKQKKENQLIQQPRQQDNHSQEQQDEKQENISVQPQDDDEEKQKEDQEKLLIEENQFIRYTRAKKILTNRGLTIDMDLIADNFDKI